MYRLKKTPYQYIFLKYYVLYRSDAHPKTQDDQLPWHWPEKVSLEGGRIGVEPVTKERIKSQFKASALHRVKVIDIEEICNAEFHQQYERYLYALFKILR